jgi:hypothetical protein
MWWSPFKITVAASVKPGGGSALQQAGNEALFRNLNGRTSGYFQPENFPG